MKKSLRRRKNQQLVTVITPAYNRASFLEETILSVLNQDYPNLEYIVLDDGSTDDTLKLIKKYKNKLVWSSHKNMGEARTVNKGIKMAHGDIIGIINSDDPLLSGAVSTIVQYMTNNPDILVVYPDWNMIDSDGIIIQHMITKPYDYSYMISRHYCLPGPGTFFKKSLAIQLKGRDSQFTYVSDFDFWLRAGLLGKFARIPKTLATFRLHSDSASASMQGPTMAQEHIKLVNKIYSIPGLPPEVVRKKNEAYCTAYYIAGIVCGNHLLLKMNYFLQSFLYRPSKYMRKFFSISIQLIYVLFYNRLILVIYSRTIKWKSCIQKISDFGHSGRKL